MNGVSPELFSPSGDKNSHVEKKRKVSETNIITIETQNKFDVLSDLEDGMDQDIPAETARGQASKSEEVTKSVRIPPIVVYSYIKNHSETLKALRAKCKKDFSVKFRGNRLLFLPATKDDYNVILNEVRGAKLECHTYTSKDDAYKTVVLRNIPPNITPTEIIEDLKEKNLNAIKVLQMKKKVGENEFLAYPLFIVTFSSDTSMKQIKDTKIVCQCIVSWAPYKNMTGVTQCFNCQSFFHIAKNCYKKPKCVKCAGEHRSKDCPAPKDSTPKCANCGKNHTSNHRGCAVYEDKLQRRAIPVKKKEEKSEFRLRDEDFPQLQNSSQTASSSSAWGRSNKTSADTNSEPSLLDVFKDIKEIFTSINISNLLQNLKLSMNKLRSAPDALTKISVVADFLFKLI